MADTLFVFPLTSNGNELYVSALTRDVAWMERIKLKMQLNHRGTERKSEKASEKRFHAIGEASGFVFYP